MKKRIELTDKERVAICGVLILGREYLTTAYLMSNPQVSPTSEASLKVMQSRWWASDLCRAFRTEIEGKLAHVSTTTGGNDLRTRGGIVSELITSVKATKGKEAITGLTALAKMQGLDRPEERPDDERRKFVLTWPSHCRTCALMRLYLDVKKKN